MKDINLEIAVNKSAFLLGAGAAYGTESLRTNCKLSSEMLADLQSKIIGINESNLNKPQIESLKFLLSCLEYHNKWRSLESKNKFEFSPNIEELALLIRRIKNRENFLPYPLTGNWADKLIQLESEHNLNKLDVESELFESIERIIKNEYLKDWLQFNDEALKYLEPLYDIMSSSNLESPLELFSLNYDLIIETFLEKKGVKPRTGFYSNEWRGMDFDDVNESFVKMNLYKLHGSLDWVRLNTGEVKMINALTEEEKNDIDVNHSPYVIFGHGTKTFSFDPFFNLTKHFKEKLTDRPYIFVIGYSFFDPYINNLIIEALNNDISKKLIIINPCFGPKNNGLAKGEFDNALNNDGKPFGNLLVEYIEEIQRNPFYSELPEFNISKINGENRIHFIAEGFDYFMNNYFNEDGKKFIQLVNSFDKESSYLDPF
jgi:hypothetical protein